MNCKSNEMKCQYCKDNNCIKMGRQRNGSQKYFCKSCNSYQQSSYQRKSYRADTNTKIVRYLKESCGIRSLSRLIGISKNTVKQRIVKISRSVKKPLLSKGKEYEMDEMRTYINNKENRYWIAYAIRRDTREVVDV